MRTAADVEAVGAHGFRLKTNRALLLIVRGGLRPVIAEPEPVGRRGSGDRAGASCEALARVAGVAPIQGVRGPRRTGAASEQACLPANGLDPGDLASAQFEIARQLGADARYQAGGSPPDGCGISRSGGSARLAALDSHATRATGPLLAIRPSRRFRVAASLPARYIPMRLLLARGGSWTSTTTSLTSWRKP